MLKMLSFILLVVRITYETFAESRNNGQYPEADMTSWVRRQAATEGGSDSFNQEDIVEGPSRTRWVGRDSLDDEDMCAKKMQKTEVVKRRGWGKRMVSEEGQLRSVRESEEGVRVSGTDEAGWEMQDASPELLCAYWENEAKNQIYNAVRAIRTRDHVCNRENNDEDT